MSEVEQEAPQEPAQEPVEPNEPAPDAEPEGEPAEPPEPAQEPAEAPGDEPGAPEDAEPSAAVTEKEIEAARKKLDRLRESNAGRVSSIMEEAALSLVPCPACADVAPGFVWHPDAAPPSDEAAAGMRALLGINAPRSLKQPDNFQACTTCDGEGFIATGSKREGYDSATCPRCTGKGYLSQGELAAVHDLNGGGEPVAIPTGPAVYGTELPPEAQALRDQGWMVAPPVVIPDTVN